MKPHPLILDESNNKHEYRLNQKPIPGTTNILGEMGFTPKYSSEDPFHRNRGRAVHKMAQLYAAGTLDISTLGDLIVPFYPAVQEFHLQYKPRIIHSELLVWHGGLNYAGQTDQAGIWKCGSPYVADYKSSDTTNEPAEYTDLQTALYMLGIQWMIKTGKIPPFPGVTTSTPWRRFGIMLWSGPKAAGLSHRLIEYKSSFSIEVAIGIVKAYHWKKNGAR